MQDAYDAPPDGASIDAPPDAVITPDAKQWDWTSRASAATLHADDVGEGVACRMSQDPFNGTWRLNIAGSKLPFPAPRSVSLRIETDGDWLCLTEESTAADGRTETAIIRARFDDEVHPVHGSGLADGFAVRRVDAFTLKTRGVKAGEIVFTATLVMAADGNSFREDAETTLADGRRAPATLVYERDSGT